jgi:hypothetical protein
MRAALRRATALPAARLLGAALLAIALLGAALPSAALADVASRAVPGPVQNAVPGATLAGEGELRWFGLKVYSARLWAERALRPDGFASAPFALDLQYAMKLDGGQIAERSAKEMERMGFGDAQRRGRWLDAMKRLFPDVGSGDRLTGINAPGRGARFYHNDRPIGGVDDPDFAAAFFAIWLDARTAAPQLRESLLRGASASAAAGAPR